LVKKIKFDETLQKTMNAGFAPEFRPSPETEVLLSNAFRDMELSLGRYTSRSDKFAKFISSRPEYPVVFTSVPFTAVNQILFMTGHFSLEEMFTLSICDCLECKGKGVRKKTRFSKLLDAVAKKYGPNKEGFLYVAHQIISKIAVGQRTFMAVFTGDTIGPKRVRKNGVTLYPGWDGESLAFKTTRTYEFYPTGFSPNPFSHCIFFTFSDREIEDGSPFKCVPQMLRPQLYGSKNSSLPPSALCDKILQRAHEVFCALPSPLPPFILERIYFQQPNTVSLSCYITVKVRRVKITKTAHYEIFILKGLPYTNIEL
jgi:hypothetical protein